ncbi:MAG: hypothetical protein EBS01_00325 [Verrucomicrobia bacterium]|nr:hypothetical protein [Verrucomicrobiota bacterium]
MSHDHPPAPAERSFFLRKRVFWAAFAIVLTGVLLHRPLLRAAIQHALSLAALREGLILNSRVSGDILTEVTFSDLQIAPSPDAHSRVDSVRVEALTLRYSLPRLIQKGPSACLRSIVASGIEIKAHPVKSQATGKNKSPRILTLLQSLVALSTSPIQEVSISDFNIELGDDRTFFSIHNGGLFVERGKTGLFRIPRLQLGKETPTRHLEAKTTYGDNLFSLSDLKLGPGVRLEKLSLNASDAAKGQAVADLSLSCGDGNLQLHFLASNLGHRFRPMSWKAEMTTDSLDCNQLAAALGWNTARLPTLTTKVELQGTPKRPESWTGTGDAVAIQSLPNGNKAFTELHAAMLNGEIQLQKLSSKTTSSEAAATGTIHFPTNWSDLKTLRAEAEVHIRAKDLAEWLPSQTQAPSSGDAVVAARIRLSHGAIQAESTAKVENVSSNFLSVESGEVEATFVTAAALTFSDGTLRLLNISLKDEKNTVQGELVWPLSRPVENASVRLEGDCAELAAAGVHIRSLPVRGSLKAKVNASVSGMDPLNFLESSCEVQGSNLHWGALSASHLYAEASARGKNCVLEDFSLLLDQHGTIHAHGAVGTLPPYAFNVGATADLAKLEKAQQFLSQIGLSQSVGGSLKMHWQGEGTLSNLLSTGTWSLQIRDAHWSSLKLKFLECSGSCLPGSLNTAPIRVETQDTRCSARIQWSNGSLQIQNIALDQWGYPALTGNLTLPISYDLRTPQWVEGGSLSGKIQTTKLDLSNLAAGAGKPGALHGSLDLLLELKGTPLQPSASFRINASGLQSAEAPKFTPLSLTATGGYKDGSLQSEGAVLSPLGAPIEFKAKIPVPIAALLRGERGAGELPIDGTLRAHNASLTVLPRIWSGLRQVNGTASLDAQVSGTLEHPGLTGQLQVQCAVVHFSSDRAPALGDVRARLEFTPKLLRISELKADVGGGNLLITGSALFNEPKNPLLDFNIKAKEVLTVRNRELSLRLNGDLALRGPWKQAILSGRAAAVNSRLQKDIEVLPLNVIRVGFIKERRQTTGKPWFTLQRKPFSDWKFNISLSTTPGDPILVRGNRLRGTADAELSLEGSGAAPTIHGAYRSTDLVALLPFARIEVSHGRIWYSRDEPFHPQLDFSGETEVRNTRVRLYIWGAAEAPGITVRSEPPMGEVDLLTLLTTGSMPSDTNENAQAMAGRAAALLFQEFTDKVFAPSGRQERFSALRRFSLDVGAINGRTGHQESRLTYRLLDDLFLIGEVGADGDFAGRVRYVLRFR